MSALERHRHRGHGWGIALGAAFVCWVVTFLIIGAVWALFHSSPAAADPNQETVLPADGVLSITRTGDLWTITTSAPASEIKYMGPGAQQIISDINYGDLCTTTETFTATGECVYLQLDGIPGENSSDPYICLGGTPSTSVPTTSAPTAPTTTPATETPSVPTPSPTSTATPAPSPTTEPTPGPTSTPGLSSSPTPSIPESTPTSSPTSERIHFAGTENSSLTSMRTLSSAPARLADTGADLGGYIFWAALAVLGLVVGMVTGRRRGFENGGATK